MTHISASLDEVDIQTSPMGNGTEDLNDGETYFEKTIQLSLQPRAAKDLTQKVIFTGSATRAT